MFTGIIETIGTVTRLKKTNGNLHITIRSSVSSKLKIDQSLSHNGVCLTVIGTKSNEHTVEAVEETLSRSNLGTLKAGSKINLERAMIANGRFDGHLVQGHVDQKAKSIAVEEKNGSWIFMFNYDSAYKNLLVEKGSVCIDGVSLTVAAVQKNYFSVAIIPYTFEHTCFQFLKKGDSVNLEFDIIGKYVAKNLEGYKKV